MKKILLITIIILELLIIDIPNYVELNNLAIIEEITIIKTKDTYKIELKEIIPIKKDQGINYNYKYYKEQSTTLENALTKIKNKTKKKLYLKKAKFLTTNISTTKKLINFLEIKPQVITHLPNDYSTVLHE